MAKRQLKYYVVWKGAKPGVYSSWKDCQEQIKGFQGAHYKSFPNKAQAELAFRSNMWDYLGKKAENHPTPASAQSEAILESWSVDAACSGNPGVMEYRCVHTGSGHQIFHGGPFPEATSNIGEFLAIVHALALLKKENSNLPIYSDSKTGMAWVKKKKANTTLRHSAKNQKVIELIERAENWLKNNTFTTKIMKWDTQNWGEIPADFGRK